MTEPKSAPTGTPASGPAAPSLSAQDQRDLVDAAKLLKPLRRAAAVARFDANCYLVGGALSLLFAVVGGIDLVGLLLGVALMSVGLVERNAARRLGVAEPGSARQAAYAEGAGLIVMSAYFLLAWLVFSPLSADFAEHMSELGSLGEGMERQSEALQKMLYPTLLAASIIGQGLMVMYFLRKRAVVAQYVEEVPEWARKVAEGMEA